MKKFAQFLKNERAFTLVELMISSLILFAVVALWLAMNKGTVSYELSNAQLNMQDAAKSALSLMSKDIRGAINFSQVTMPAIVPLPGGPQPWPYSSLTFRTNDQVIRYRLQQIPMPAPPPRLDLVKDLYDTPNWPPAGTFTTLTLLQDVEMMQFWVGVVDAAWHPTQKQVDIVIKMKAPFIKEDNFKKTFRTQVFVRNPL